MHMVFHLTNTRKKQFVENCLTTTIPVSVWESDNLHIKPFALYKNIEIMEDAYIALCIQDYWQMYQYTIMYKNTGWNLQVQYNTGENLQVLSLESVEKAKHQTIQRKAIEHVFHCKVVLLI